MTLPPLGLCRLRRAAPTTVAILLAASVWLVAFAALAVPNLSTPRQAMEAFNAASARGDFATAVQCLDLRDLARAQRATQGILLAQELHYVLDRHATQAVETLPDEPEPAGQGDLVVASEIALHGEPVQVALSRVRLEGGTSGWLISRATVSAIPVLYRAYGPPRYYFSLPDVLRHYEWLGAELWQWIGLVVGIVVAYVAAYLLSGALRRLAQIFTRRTKTPWDDSLVDGLRRPVRLVLTIGAYELLEPALALPGDLLEVSARVARIATIVATGWFLACCLAVGTAWAGDHLGADLESELKYRGVRTQLLLLRRVGLIIIGVVGGAVVLLQFELVRSVGVSLLASAGLAGIVVGLALQKSVGGIIAGIQVSLTQPFRLGDVVVVENEHGTVEQINLTYVVIRVWDDRRLIVPMQRILEQPFQNWTKVGRELLGVVLLRCDYATPIGALRQQIREIVATCSDWDGRRCDVEVVEAGEVKIDVRILVSSTSPEGLWRVRCALREKIVAYLAAHDMGRTIESGPREAMTRVPS